MNRLIGFAAFMAAVFWALACSSGGEGLTVNYGDDIVTDDTISITGFYDSDELGGTPTQVYAKPGGTVAGQIAGELFSSDQSYIVEGLDEGVSYIIELQDGDGEVLGQTSISGSDVTASSKPSLGKARLAPKTGYDVTRTTTYIVQIARARGFTDPTEFADTVFVNFSFAGFSIADQGLPTSIQKVDSNLSVAEQTIAQNIMGLIALAGSMDPASFLADIGTSLADSTTVDAFNIKNTTVDRSVVYTSVTTTVFNFVTTFTPPTTLTEQVAVLDVEFEEAEEDTTDNSTDDSSDDSSDDNSSDDPAIFVNATDIDEPNFALSSSAPSITVNSSVFTDSFFTAVDYVGAVGGSSDWTEGWTKAGTEVTDPVLDIDYSEISNAQLQDTANWVAVEETDAGGGKIYSLTGVSGSGNELIRIVSGEFHDDVTFDSDYEYLLSGYVIIGDPSATSAASSNLTIEAGTVIRGMYDTNALKIGMLVVRQNAQIFAEGTADEPIIMTSMVQDGALPARWGGLAICGNAPYADSSTGESATKNAEGFDSADQVTFGDGSDAADNSGTLKYVRVEYAGYQFDSDNQFNGIALFSVGNGTTIEHVQIHRNSDDGIEYFGGTVNTKWLLVTGAQDDSIDWTNGYVGKIQFAIVQQYPGLGGDRGIEASSKQTGIISNPTLSNLTIIGGASDDGGLYFDTQTQASIYNSIVANWDDGVKIGDEDTAASGITILSTMFLNDTNDAPEAATDSSNELLSESTTDLEETEDSGDSSTSTNPTIFVDASDIDAPEFSLSSTVPSVTVDTTPFEDSFFDAVSYIGAVGGGSDWTTGWTKTGTDVTEPVLDIDYSEISNAQLQNTSNWVVVEESDSGTGKIYRLDTDEVDGAGSNLIRIVQGEFYDDVTFDSDYEYLLSGYVIIGDPDADTAASSNLTIEAGTVIRGLYDTEDLKIGMLVVRQNAQIFAEGTADEPIIMTSTIQDGALPARWGGLAICGNAPYADSSTGASATKNAEGFDSADQVTFGDGSDAADNSGVLSYVRVEYAGYQFDSDNQFNGIALFSVGNGTTIEYVQIHRNSDDGIEYFGGTVDTKYLLVTGAQDDSIDWTNGYTGRIQFAIVQQYPGLGGDRGIEASSKQTGLVSNPTLSNLTIIGGASDDGGLYFDTQTQASVYNSIVANWDDGVKIGDDDTVAANIIIRSTLFLNETNAGTTNDADDTVTDSSLSLLSEQNYDLSGTAATPIIFVNATDIDEPDFSLATLAPSVAVDTSVFSDSFFTTVDYIGAVGTTDWTSGWTKAGTEVTDPVLDIDYSEISNAQLQDSSNWEEITTLTDAGGGKIYSLKNISGSGNEFIRVVQGEFHDDVTFESDYEYLLSGYVIIGDPDATSAASSSLTIDPGTIIRGLYNTTELEIGMLVVRQNAQIFAEGTADEPIIMTSMVQDGALPARWGGLAICGNAPYADSSTGAAATKNAEGFDSADEVTFGDGTNAADNSGVLKYVRVEYAGYQFDSDNQFNGIALFSVGNGTTIEHVQIHRNSDDGIEYFGGTVDTKWLLVTGAQDDSIDWTNGYTGRIQFAIVQQYPDLGGDRGIEASSKQTGLVSNPTLSNLTIIGGASDDGGLYFDTQTQASIYNSIVANWDDGVKIGDTDTAASGLTIRSTLFYNTTNAGTTNDADDTVSDDSNTLLTGSAAELEGGTAPALAESTSDIIESPFDIDEPDFAVQSGTNASVTKADVNAVATRSGGVGTFFDTVDFIGGVDPDSDWTADWTKTGTDITESNLDIDYSEISNAQLQDSDNWTEITSLTDAGGGKIYSLTGVSGSGNEFIRIVTGEFHDDVSFDSSYEYLLSGYVIIGDPAETTAASSNLTIAANTVIRGLYNTTDLEIGMLVVRQNAQIFAQGTADQPIIMTSTVQDGALPARWGGLAICGNAPYADSTSGTSQEKNAEGFDTADQVTFGDGSVSDDDSGILEYVRVEYAGYQFDSDNQFNGIALFSVGSGTNINHVQIHRNSDDGIEFFGGTVNVKYLLVTGAQDDSIDWTNGYTGLIQYAVVQQYPGLGGDRGIEASSKQTGLISYPVLSNLTIIGGASDDAGFYFDTQTQAEIYNSVVINWDTGVLINSDTDKPTLASGIIVDNTLFSNTANASTENDSADVISNGTANVEVAVD